MARKHSCRSCGANITHSFCDLGVSPLANSYLKAEQLSKMEPFYPLHAFVCEKCLLVQLDEFESPEHIFSDYAYFSSYSESWLQHAKKYVDTMVDKFKLNSKSFVVEIASNDGYLLKNFIPHGVPMLGVEPARNVADFAIKGGVPTHCGFFGEELGKSLRAKHGPADLMAANNVFAHVPQLNDFILGFKALLNDEGVITFEFPHLLELIRGIQFDTIYHEHFSYFSLLSAKNALGRHGLRVFDVEQLPTHGGSLRLFVCHDGSRKWETGERVKALLQTETEAGLDRLSGYHDFELEVQKIKRGLLTFLIEAKQAGKKIVAYGAPAKGNTMLNYCGVRTDFIEYTVDRSPHKQNTYLPGTRIPVRSPEAILETKPDYVLILPWNIKNEIVSQMEKVRSWGGKFVVSHPSLQVF